MSKKNYEGFLLAANPLNPQDEMDKSVILILTHTTSRAVGLQINNPLEHPNLQAVTTTMGMWYDGDDPLWFGGNQSQNKVHVIHSSDWQGMSTIQLTDEICVTNDLSILAALSRNEGPEKFRACVGFWLWERNVLDQQLNPKSKNELYRWETTPATANIVFNSEGPDQWRTVINHCAKFQVASWF